MFDESEILNELSNYKSSTVIYKCTGSLKDKHEFLISYMSIRDYRIQTLSYARFESSDINEVFIGGFPYSSGSINRCKTCNRKYLSYHDFGGHSTYIRYEELDKSAKYNLDYVSCQFKLSVDRFNLIANNDTIQENVEVSNILNFNKINVRDIDHTIIINVQKRMNMINFDLLGLRENVLNVQSLINLVDI